VSDTAKDIRDAELAFRSGDFARADRRLRRVLSSSPSHARANELMAYVAANTGNDDDARHFLVKATSEDGATATAWYYLGVWHRKHGAPPDAIRAFERALAIDASLFPARHDLGLSLRDLGENAAALAAFDAAIALDATSVEAHHNRARALHAIGDLDAALASYGNALSLDPSFAPAWFNRAETQNDLRRHDEALSSYERASQLGYPRADVDWNVSLTNLLLGDFEKGWAKYEARWSGTHPWERRHSHLPAWVGDDVVKGKRLLVWAEQGLGDTLHFCRYAPLLAQRFSSVVLEVQPSLKGLLSALPGCEVHAIGEALPACDLQIPLLSLPLAFGTTLGTIPAEVPYLRADAGRVAEWKSRLPSRGDKPRIAVACSGRATQKDDRYRSISLEELAPLTAIGQVFIVQPELRDADRRFAAAHSEAMHSLEGQIRDFDDSAAILESMDCVVTIDTSLAHLAGAMAKPVSILLPWTPTWRWLVDRPDSPWYPTARLYRQQSRGDWSAAIEAAVAGLLAR
jgi:Tfp pilus assembly protein PilF